MMLDPNATSVLQRLPLLARLSPQQFQQIASAFQLVRLMPGQRLFSQNEAAAGYYVVAAGGAQLLRNDAAGIERSIKDVHPGEALAEEALFFNEPQPVSALIVRPSDVLVLTRQAFEQVITANPSIMQALNPRVDIAQRLAAQQQRGVRTDERVLLFTRRHAWAFVGKFVRLVILLLLMLALAYGLDRANILTPLLPLVVLGAAFLLPGIIGVYFVLEWTNDTYTVSDQRVIHDERNLLTFAQRREQALISNIQSINVRRNGLFSELFNYGDLVISTAGTPQPVVLDTIPKPYHAQEVIFSVLKQRGIIPGSTVPIPEVAPPPRPNGNAASEIFRVLIPRMRVVEGDRVTYRRHWLVLVRNLFMPTLFYGLLAILLSVWISGALPVLRNVSGGVVIIGALVWMALNTFWWYWEYADWRDDLFVVDNLSVVDLKRHPLWLQEVRIQAGLSQVQNVTSQVDGIVDRLYNKGRVIIQTAAEQGKMVFEDISNPQQVAEEVLQRVQRYNEMRANAFRDDQRRAMESYFQQRGQGR
jgi:CRP-like cAMP-binding protein